MRLTFFSPQNVPKSKERGKTAVFAGYFIGTEPWKWAGQYARMISCNCAKQYKNNFYNSYKKNLLNKEDRVNGSFLEEGGIYQ